MKSSRVLYRKTVLWTSIIVMLLISVTMVNVASASPDTHFWINPPEKLNVLPGSYFILNVEIAEAPSTYAWEIYLRWDPSLLKLDAPAPAKPVMEGLFLKAAGSTDFVYTPVDEANLKGEILVHCSLIGNVSIVDWPSGDGTLCRLAFKVEGLGSTLINLLDTRLWDHLDEGYPAPTYYRNEDCFFRNVDPPIHDLRITDVTAPSEVNVGDVANIDATVLNEGTETETFDLTVYADGTPIGTTTVVDLPGTGNSEDRSFTYDVAWDTTGVATGTYTISAYAEPHVNETDTADNTFTDGTVEVLAPPDLKVVKVTVITPEVKMGPGALGVINVEVMNEGPRPVVFDIVVFGNYPTVVTAAYGKALAAGATGVFGTYWPTWYMPNGIPAPEGTYAIMAYVLPLPGEVDLADNMLPAGPEFDGEIIITYAEAELVEWKLKINNKVGIGKGHKSSVGTENTLKAYVGEGTRDVLVRAKFEITDSVGTIIAEVYSNVAFMPVGQTAIVEGSWTATYPGIFFITAYLFYGTAYPIIPDGMSRTQSLRVDTPVP